MPAAKPTASLSLDLDNLWSYMKTHGDPGWEHLPSYLDLVVPRILEFLRPRNLTITFFVVGQDAALVKNQPALSLLASAGHEVGNHSFHHEPWLHLYSEQQLEEEVTEAEQAICTATQRRPIGFAARDSACHRRPSTYSAGVATCTTARRCRPILGR